MTRQMESGPSGGRRRWWWVVAAAETDATSFRSYQRQRDKARGNLVNNNRDLFTIYYYRNG